MTPPATVWSDPTDRFRARSIDERDLRPRLRSLHYYGNLKRSKNVYSKWRQGSKLSTGERTNFIAAPQTKNDWISVSVLGRRLPSLRTMYLRRLKGFRNTFRRWMRNEKTFPTVCLTWCSACSCWDIALWVCRPNLSLLEAEKSTDKGLTPMGVLAGMRAHAHTHHALQKSMYL